MTAAARARLQPASRGIRRSLPRNLLLRLGTEPSPLPLRLPHGQTCLNAIANDALAMIFATSSGFIAT